VTPTHKKPRRRKHRSHNIVIKIPLTAETLTAAMLFLQELLALLHTLKIPMQVEKVAREP
jgi:hypothetical protein